MLRSVTLYWWYVAVGVVGYADSACDSADYDAEVSEGPGETVSDAGL